MADALVSIALQKIMDALDQRVSLFLGAAGELQKLYSTFQSIQALLRDAESKQVANESVLLWLSRLQEVGYDIDDLLDERLISGLENEGSDVGCTNGIKVFAKSFAFVSRNRVAWKVKEIRERLDQIADEKNKYDFSTSGNSGADRIPGGNRPPTTLLIASSEMIGRENDKQTVISQLVSGSSQEEGKIRVIAIIGIGGQGKTTLAQEICNSKEVKDHFKTTAWVCVAENFDTIRIMKAILEELRVSASVSGFGSLQRTLCEALEGKRFLLILDDMWNADNENWVALRLSLTSGASGSRILVTTRNTKVGTAMGAAYTHELNRLSDDHCWKLFKGRAFAGWKEEDCLKFEEVGQKIVRKCKGMPLLAQVMGSAMNSEKKAAAWENILGREIWSLPGATDKMLSVLLLSYCSLPAHLKQCFKYCSMFPKAEELAKDTLVRLWVAQGFVQSEENRELEEVGTEYFDDLVARSMIQVDKRYEVVKYKMHDLLHDLAQLISKGEIGIFVSGNSGKCSINVRHASMYFTDDKPSIPFAFHRAKKLRTLYLNGVRKIDKSIVNLLHHARLLRALHFSASEIQMLPKNIGKLYHLRYLDLSHSKIEKLPSTIGKLKYLRYLDLSHSKIIELPKSTSHLQNLHSLRLNHCGELRRLPRGMGRMDSLRHLEISKTDKLECLPKGLGRISSLRSLCKFIVGGEGGCGLDELQRLNHLQGNLTIKHMERASSEEEARKAQLWNKSYLSTLHLSTSEDEETETTDMTGVIKGLQPHPNVEVLKIHCKSSSKLPKWIEDSSFSELTKVTIDGFIRCANLRGLGKLPALKYLHMGRIGVKNVGHEFYYGGSSSDVGRRGAAAFPKLEELVLKDMSEFENWELTGADDRQRIMPSLRVLKLNDCPKLESLPRHLAKTPLKDMEIEDCDKIKAKGCSFPHLQELRVKNSSDFFSGSLPALARLKKFHIFQIRNQKLTEEGWERLKSLEELQILYCSELESLPKGLGRLQALKSLDIGNLEALTDLPDELGELKSLQTLRLDGCPKLESLPDGIADLHALRSLKITNCDALGSLLRGVQVLPNHLQLEIRGCPKWSETREWRGQWKERKRDDSPYVDEDSATEQRKEREGDESSDADEDLAREERKESEGDDSGEDTEEWEEEERVADESGSDRDEWVQWEEEQERVSDREERTERESDDSGMERDKWRARVTADDSGLERDKWRARVADDDSGMERDKWRARVADDDSGSDREEWKERVASERGEEEREGDNGPKGNHRHGMQDRVQKGFLSQIEYQMDEVGNSCSIS